MRAPDFYGMMLHSVKVRKAEKGIRENMVAFIEAVYRFLWGDIITIPLPGGNSLGLSLLVILLIPTGIYFTVRTKFLPIRLFPDMVRALKGKKEEKNSLSTFQTLVVSTATRVGMGTGSGRKARLSISGTSGIAARVRYHLQLSEQECDFAV